MKGAPERIIARCSKIMVEGKVLFDNNWHCVLHFAMTVCLLQEVKMTGTHRDKFHEAYEVLAGHGERVLGFAHFELDPDRFPPTFEFDPDNHNFPVVCAQCFLMLCVRPIPQWFDCLGGYDLYWAYGFNGSTSTERT
jgi:hypothetical protein